MKKIMLAVCAMTMALLMLAGCASSKRSDAQKDTAPTTQAPTTAATETTVPTTEAAPTESTAAPKTVSPLPSGIDPAHLDDCTVAVSFDEGDAYVDDTGMMQLKVKVYAYDIYDTVDISMLQVGDQITICRQDVKVTSLERDAYGAVIINGGPENGGYRLISGNGDESGFFAVEMNDAKLYYELGEATIPVSADEFIFEDSSNPEKGTCTYYPGDFLVDNGGIEYHFVPNNTTITIQGGYVVNMQRVYIP